MTTMRATIARSCRRRGFTLLEVLVAALCMAVLLAALSIPVSGGLRERERAEEDAVEAFRLRRVMDRVVNDLDGLLPPGTALTGQFVGTRNDTRDGRRDSLVFATCAGSQRAGAERAGGCVRVAYEVTESDDGTGYDWTRTETLNPLSDDEDATVESVLLRNVQSLELDYYDGTTWQESWDSSSNSGLPLAIQVIFALAPENEDDAPVMHRLLMPVLIEEAEEQSSGREGQQ
jgi:prepilin-type N-terminal cleavage/methylation domain-containing protein